MRRRTFREYVTPPPQPRGLDVTVTLRDLALVTYTADPDTVRRQLPPRLSPLTISMNGARRALVSVVLFMNENFRSAVFPSPRLRMGQVNYRTYIVDHFTGKHGIWFFGTMLDSWTFAAPRWLWRMPWHKGPVELHSRRDAAGAYVSYMATSASDWSPLLLELEEDAGGPIELPGFPDVETGLVCLTHVMKSFYRRTDGQIGLNRVWHLPMSVRPAQIRRADFPLLQRMALVPRAEQLLPYNVLIAPKVEFLIHLPPERVSSR